MAKIFIHKYLKESLSPEKAQDLVDDFKDYKESKRSPASFVDDTPYDVTYNRLLQSQHIQLKHKGRQPINLVRFRRINGYLLVYCSGLFDKNNYLLIAIIRYFDPKKSSEINNTDKDNHFMAKLEEIAERFQQKF